MLDICSAPLHKPLIAQVDFRLKSLLAKVYIVYLIIILLIFKDFLITGGLGSATSAEIWSPGKKNQVCELPKLDSTRIAHSQNGLHVCGGVKGKTCSKLQNGYWSRTHSLPEKRVHHVSWETNSGIILMGGVSSPSTSTVIKGSEVKKGFGLKYDLR